MLDLPLSPDAINEIHPVKQYSPSSSSANTPLTSVTHTYSGSHFLTTSPSGTLLLYETTRPKLVKTIYSKKYGCTSAAFTLRGSEGSVPQSCLVASTIPTTQKSQNDHAIRLLDLSTNAFSKYFHGHQDQVLTLMSCPWSSEGFCSSSLDGTVKFWDTRSNSSIASANLGEKSQLVIGCDPSGQVMAIWKPSSNDSSVIGTLMIVPTNGYPEKLIGKIEINKSDLGNHALNDYRVESVKFNNDRLIILGFVNQDLLVVDSISLKVKQRLTDKQRFTDYKYDIWRSTGSFDISWDGNWCFGGSGSNELLVWNLNTAQSIVKPHRRISNNNECPRIVNGNPKFDSIITADTNLVLHSIY